MRLLLVAITDMSHADFDMILRSTRRCSNAVETTLNVKNRGESCKEREREGDNKHKWKMRWPSKKRGNKTALQWYELYLVRCAFM